MGLTPKRRRLAFWHTLAANCGDTQMKGGALVPQRRTGTTQGAGDRRPLVHGDLAITWPLESAKHGRSRSLPGTHSRLTR